MKRTFIEMGEAGDLLIRQALDEAEAADLPRHEIKRLRLLADSPYRAVIDCQSWARSVDHPLGGIASAK